MTKGTTKVTETLMTERTLVMEGKTLVTKVRPKSNHAIAKFKKDPNG